MSHVGKSVYLPDLDIYDPDKDGVYIFKPFPDECYVNIQLDETSDKSYQYDHVRTFYQKISTDSEMTLDLIGEFLMGTTLSFKSSYTFRGKERYSYADLEGLSDL